jgi:transposase
MTQTPVPQPSYSAAEFDRTLVLALEVSEKSWVVAAHVPGPGLQGSKPRRTLPPTAEALLEAVETYRARAARAGRTADRVVLVYEAGYSGFWLARWLARHGVGAFVVQPSSVPVDRRARRAESDGIDAELLLRTLLAWLRGEPRVCSMVPIPTEADEDARRCVRERQDLLGERVAIANGIASVLATLGARGYDPLRRDRRQRLEGVRTALGDPLPAQARARIERMLDRLELVLTQIAALERQRDAVLDEAAPGEAERMIQRLVRLRGIGVQSATLLVREAFVRPFANGKALGAYAGLSPTPYSSGGTEREQGIGRAGNARLRTAMVELAWIWQRYQPGSVVVGWFRGRLGGAARRLRKVMVVALARKLLIALWRFATQGVIPQGAALEPAA